ncbi:MAG TPA: benzoyl-CoA reductase subunit C [Candidatus Polarisedimenticolia bacterium]|nr:benzoyl-CoA reductase subunit C [Candidatus Polarisedimenticolia bacterium]
MRSPAGPEGELGKIVGIAEKLYRDTALGSVREWKGRTGSLAVGFMPVYIPRELLHAQGVLPVGIMGGGDNLEIIRGDAYYQSYICHIPRSTLEMGLDGSLDVLDGMIFPATCDVIRNLSGMWKLQFPHKLSFYLDVPQDFDRGIGGEFYGRALMDLSRALTARGARPYEAASLRKSIALYNANRMQVESLFDLRRREPWKVPTSELYLLLRAGQVLCVEDFTKLLADYGEALEADTTRRMMDQARVVVTGSFCEQPPLGLIRTLERSGCYIVDDDFVQVHRWIRGPIRETADPLDALVEAFLDQGVDSPIRFIAGGEKGSELVRRVRCAGAEGVVFCAASFCDPALLDQPMAIKVLEKAGVPYTAFKFAENNGQFQVIREQTGTFADSIKLWSDEGNRHADAH